MTIPPDALLDPSLSCGPYSAWCISMVTKRSLVLVSRACIFIRRVIAIQTLLAILTDNPRLGALVRNLTIMRFVPRIYRAAIDPDLTQILNFCPTVKTVPLPALPSTVTSLKLSIDDNLSDVFGTLQQCCAQLEDLSAYSQDDEMIDAHKLSFPRLHALHLILRESTSVQSFSTEWDMPRL
ncbi:hypothetical protein B0H13DRAFT_2012261 [Mycena leptocephala]|nr:hypothetical protein B0H13DRAFT_2012261 [Mycena leptocephala]